MIIKNNRKQLDKCLDDPKSTALLLVGPVDSKSKEVYDCFKNHKWDLWQFYFLITDISILTEEESKKWFNENSADYYAVVGGAELPKKVAQYGPITDLLKKNGEPGYLKIRQAVLKGDKL